MWGGEDALEHGELDLFLDRGATSLLLARLVSSSSEGIEGVLSTGCEPDEQVESLWEDGTFEVGDEGRDVVSWREGGVLFLELCERAEHVEEASADVEDVTVLGGGGCIDATARGVGGDGAREEAQEGGIIEGSVLEDAWEDGLFAVFFLEPRGEFEEEGGAGVDVEADGDGGVGDMREGALELFDALGVEDPLGERLEVRRELSLCGLEHGEEAVVFRVEEFGGSMLEALEELCCAALWFGLDDVVVILAGHVDFVCIVGE